MMAFVYHDVLTFEGKQVTVASKQYIKLPNQMVLRAEIRLRLNFP
jgi:hypothetical protein